MAELTALSSRKSRAIATFLDFYVSHGSATMFLSNREKYIYFIDNLLLFATVKEFSKSVNSWWSYRKRFDSTFFLRHSVSMIILNAFCQSEGARRGQSTGDSFLCTQIAAVSYLQWPGR